MPAVHYVNATTVNATSTAKRKNFVPFSNSAGRANGVFTNLPCCIFAHHNFVKFTDCLVLTHCWLEVRLSSPVFQSIHIEEAQLRPDRADCKLSCFRLPNHPNVIFFLEAFVCVKAVSGGNAVKAALS